MDRANDGLCVCEVDCDLYRGVRCDSHRGGPRDGGHCRGHGRRRGHEYGIGQVPLSSLCIYVLKW